MESLQKWASVLQEHIDKLKIPPEEMRDMEQKCKCLCIPTFLPIFLFFFFFLTLFGNDKFLQIIVSRVSRVRIALKLQWQLRFE